MLRGNLSSFSLISLLQVCDNENKSGAIVFSDPENERVCGKIYSSQGTPVYAYFLDQLGIEAIKLLHLASRHDFYFQESLQPPEKNVHADLNFLLLECSKHKDEVQGYLQKLEPEIKKRFDVSSVRVFAYEAQCLNLFAEMAPILELEKIEYYEFSTPGENSFVFLDKNISTHVQVDTPNTLYTDEIIDFLHKKDLLP